MLKEVVIKAAGINPNLLWPLRRLSLGRYLLQHSFRYAEDIHGRAESLRVPIAFSIARSCGSVFSSFAPPWENIEVNLANDGA